MCLVLTGWPLLDFRCCQSLRGAAFLMTTGCERPWKTSSFTWPVWTGLVGVAPLRSVVGLDFSQPAKIARTELASRGIHSILQCPIRRSDQGGYGSFGAASVAATA